MNPLEQIAARAAREKRKIVLPEGADARVAAAAAQAAERGLTEVTVIAEGKDPDRGRCGTAAGALGARLIHLLNHLKRQRDTAHPAALAVPNQLHLALVVKQQKTVAGGRRHDRRVYPILRSLWDIKRPICNRYCIKSLMSHISLFMGH